MSECTRLQRTRKGPRILPPIFVIATSGRCGTQGLCDGLNRFSDHTVDHEPDQPLREAWLKHHGQPYESERLDRWLARLPYAGRYGLSWRAPNLLDDIIRVAPRARVLVIVREPCAYVRSAHSKRVLSKGDEWDRMRLMPDADGSLAERIAWHWRTVNAMLLEFAEAHDARVAVLGDLGELVDTHAGYLGVRVDDRDGLHAFLATRPNAARSQDLPEGYDPAAISAICASVWDRARAVSY